MLLLKSTPIVKAKYFSGDPFSIHRKMGMHFFSAPFLAHQVVVFLLHRSTEDSTVAAYKNSASESRTLCVVDMSLASVMISEEVWLTCVTHALSTETEEIMGLLLGDVKYSDNGYGTAFVWAAAPQKRSDRQKDRVETNPEQLAAASAQAEKISSETGTLTRVIGWYHSHPHITVLPSHIDVKTQGMYQQMDPGFIGLIFSCFNDDGNKAGRIQAIAFQASKGRGSNYSQISHEAITETGYSKRNVTDLSTSMDKAAEVTRTEKVNNGYQSHPTTLDDFFPNTNVEGNATTDYLEVYGKVDQPTNMDSFDLTAGMQEAMHLSNLEMSNSEFTRKEVPLQVVPSHILTKIDFPLSSLIDLQKILFDEEQHAYSLALLQSIRNGKVHPLTSIHHAALYQASICKLMEYCLSPVIDSLWDKLQQNNARLLFLQEEEVNLQSLGGKISRSQRRKGLPQAS